MTKHLNILGDAYDEAEPCFLTTGGDAIYNRVRRQWYSAASLLALAESMGYVWEAHEVGVPSADWIAHHGDAGVVWAEGTGLGSAPENTLAPVLSGSTVVPALLTCTEGTWTGTPEPTITFAWTRDGVPIPGEESDTYLTQAGEDESAEIICEVSAGNINGSATEPSNGLTMDAPVAAVVDDPPKARPRKAKKDTDLK